MIDTVALTLPMSSFAVLENNRFTPSTEGLLSKKLNFGGRPYLIFVQNPSKEDLAKGIYRPRLTITVRPKSNGIEATLKIEFSVPKLLYGNNFVEVSDDDFPQIVATLVACLKEMGVMVYSHKVVSAEVSKIDFSKNIILKDWTSTMTIRLLEKVDLTKVLDLARTKFRNEGHGICYHANSFEVVFYDKQADLLQARKSEKRAIESDNYSQLNLFENRAVKQLPEILRMEVRLARRKCKQLLGKVHLPTDLTFQALFKASVSKTMLNYYWQHIEKDAALLLFDTNKPSSLFGRILSGNPEIKASKALMYTGASILVAEMGVRGFRQAIKPYFSDKTWQRLNSTLKKLSMPSNAYIGLLSQIRHCLDEFQPVRQSSYNETKEVMSVL